MGEKILFSEKIFEALIVLLGPDIEYNSNPELAIIDKSIKDDDYWKINLEGTKVVFEATAKVGIKKFIYLSTGCVYGFWGGHTVPDQFPIIEDNYKPSLDEGLTVYGATKIASEDFLRENSKSSNIKSIALRTEGPGAGGTRIEWINGLQNLIIDTSCLAFE